MQHHLIEVRFKDGVYERREANRDSLPCRKRMSGGGGRWVSHCMKLGVSTASGITRFQSVLLPRGGIPPAARRRSRLALTLAEREDTSRGIACGSSIREMARDLHRSASTVSREIARHGGRPAYRAHDADTQAWRSTLRPKKCSRRESQPAEYRCE